MNPTILFKAVSLYTEDPEHAGRLIVLLLQRYPQSKILETSQDEADLDTIEQNYFERLVA